MIIHKCIKELTKEHLLKKRNPCIVIKLTFIVCFFREVLKTVKTLDNDEVEKIKPKRKENPDNVRRVEFILSEDNFEDLFPRRHRSYTYTRLLQVKEYGDHSL